MPEATDYRPMHGRSKGHDLADGTHTRVKIDLFPEYIRHLPPQKRAVWDVVGRALCSRAVAMRSCGAWRRALERRFGPDYAKVGMFPIPMLTRDIPGYLITPHTDTRWKGITVQLYLPRDRSTTAYRHDLPSRSLPTARCRSESKCVCAEYRLCLRRRHRHLAFGRCGRPGSAQTRDSILLTYFVDAGALRFFRNRGKRLGNFVAQRSAQPAALARSLSGRRITVRPLSGMLRMVARHGHPQTSSLDPRRALGLYVTGGAADRLFRRQRAIAAITGSKAKQDIDQQIACFRPNSHRLQARTCAMGAPRSAAQIRRLDPDMLDERARSLLDYADPNDLTLMFDTAAAAVSADGGP